MSDRNSDRSTAQRFATAGELAWQAWDDQFVFFVPDSGDTHLLNRFSAELLWILQQDGPADVDTLSRRMAARLELDFNDVLVAQIDALAQQLDEKGLIAAVS